MAQKIQEVGLCWLRPAVQTATQVEKEVLVEHYISVLPFKSKNWVMCHQPTTLEVTVTLMEVYALVEAVAYLIPKVWKGQARIALPGQTGAGPTGAGM